MKWILSLVNWTSSEFLLGGLPNGAIFPCRTKAGSGHGMKAEVVSSYFYRSAAATQNQLPLVVRVGRVIFPSDLITLVMHNENHANRHERGRDDKDQNAAAQGLNHPSTGGGRLRIAERATLGEGRERGSEQGQSNQGNTNKECRSLDPQPWS